MDLAAKLAKATKKFTALQGKIKTAQAVRGAASLAATENLTVLQAEAAKLKTDLSAMISTLKKGALASQFKGFVREGRLSKADFDKLKIEDFAGMPTDAVKAILSSYAERPVSADLFQHGQAGARPVAAAVTTLGASETRELLALQRKGKSAKLAEGDPPPKKKDGEGDDKEDSDSSLKYEDMEDAIKQCEGLSGVVEKIMGSMKKMSDHLKKLSESEPKDKDLEEEESEDDED